MSTTQELVERLREATGADRKADEALALMAGWRHVEEPVTRVRAETGEVVPGTMSCWYRPEPEGHEDFVPRYTASLDAAIALVERMLPGWFWDVSLGCMCDEGGPYWAELYNTDIREPNYNGFWSGSRDPIEHCAPTPALALLIALLEALSAKGEHKP